MISQKPTPRSHCYSSTATIRHILRGEFFWRGRRLRMPVSCGPIPRTSCWLWSTCIRRELCMLILSCRICLSKMTEGVSTLRSNSVILAFLFICLSETKIIRNLHSLSWKRSVELMDTWRQNSTVRPRNAAWLPPSTFTPSVSSSTNFRWHTSLHRSKQCGPPTATYKKSIFGREIGGDLRNRIEIHFKTL